MPAIHPTFRRGKWTKPDGSTRFVAIKQFIGISQASKELFEEFMVEIKLMRYQTEGVVRLLT